ncbi:unnamed protein product (macronuclear) [Paramecium tetraurelia]|uniref:DUF4200 domain-containing protein n=1 Tax=Paramecium tetraurelia TaxID=5888 RepID=A0BBR9_PARTE|nr:uncharacterized protein GSPATT00000421001 [Paramecium tetraurelia]CAK55986.1 unnamed protein product [Paramecium tetraurelia]|eukprot:XP_001423384.1 hypothetical protein (macronuclear) [Paramecium tetraurelia strain d4-2]
MYEAEYADQTPVEDGLEDVEVVVSKERRYQQELLLVYNQKEIEYKQLREYQKQIIYNIQRIREKEYQKEVLLVDPYLSEYIKELEEQQLYDLDSQKQDIKADKQSRIDQLKQIQQAKNSLKLLFTQTEISSHSQILYKNMLENFNQELFQYMQERADLEDEQFEFDKRLKSLRAQIRQQKRIKNQSNRQKIVSRVNESSIFFCIYLKNCISMHLIIYYFKNQVINSIYP